MTAQARRPGPIPVALAALCAVLNVWSFAQADWNGVWAAWLALFLTEELWAAWAKTGGTLSTRLWAWLGIRPRRPWRQARIGAAGVFCLEFGLHVVTGGAFWWSGGAAIIGTAVPVVIVVAYALLREREGSVGLKDKAVRWLALRWLRGKANESRKAGGVMKMLDGWKSLILVLGFIGAALYALATGHDVSVLVRGVFGAFGWDVESINTATGIATVVAPLLWAMWAAGSRLWKVVKQLKAGAKPGELLSAEGYIKAELAEKGVTKTLTAVGVPTSALKG